VWHSEIGQTARRRTWRAVAEGRARVVVGARSALFLPFAALGLIVVDEEHDGAFKQEDGVPYHARDMAVVLGSLGRFPVVLSSATPSLETVVNVEGGRYGEASLPARHGQAELPRIAAVDLRREAPAPGRWLSPPLIEAVRASLAAGEQAMLFLNRRGYAPLTLCRSCGFRLQCPNCTAWLVEHRFERRLQCHHCGHRAALPMECPGCRAENTLRACGPGVERVAEEAAQLFPGSRTEILTSDTLPGPRAAAEAIERITRHAVDLVIGTQIVAKGHHFPLLTMVGVVDGDLGLAGGDLRAAERTWQLMVQVAGRAGRAERPGQVLIQTYQPEHPVMAALIAGDRGEFMAREAAARRELGMPPFGRLAALVVQGRDGQQVAATARDLARAQPREPGLEVLGPAPAPLALLRGRHRHRLLLKAERGLPVSALLKAWLGRVKVPSSVRVLVDVDPYSFL
jgi:primosomal protein N' (replication factor Y)